MNHGHTPAHDLDDGIVSAALVDELGVRDDLPPDQARRRVEQQWSTLSPAEQRRTMRRAMLAADEPEPRIEWGTMRTPDGRDVPCAYAIVDEDRHWRLTEARRVSEIRYASWLVREARRGLPAPSRCTRRESHGRQPGHRRRTSASSTSSSADPGGDADGPGEAGHHLSLIGARP